MHNPYIEILDSETRAFALVSQPTLESIAHPLTPFMSKLYRIVSKFLINIRYFGKDFKRSELKSVIDNNRRDFDLFFHNRLGAIPDIQIPIVVGMTVTYEHMATTLLSLAAKSKIETLYVSLDQLCSYLEKLISSENTEAHHKIENIYHTVSDTASEIISTTDDTLRSLINPNHPLGDTYARKMYKTRKDLYNTCTKVEEFDDIYRIAIRHKASTFRCFTRVDKVVKRLSENQGHVTKDDMVYFAIVLSRTAKCLELYGAVLNIMQQTEHLFTQGFVNILKMP